jgi:thioredoxin
MPDDTGSSAIDVACLCAAWCRTCDEYRPVFDGAVDELRRAGATLRVHWIDIEDEAELVGDYDVETFPTIVVADASHLRFAGPLTPQRETLQRLLRATIVEAASSTAWPTAEPAVQALATGLRRRQPEAGPQGALGTR